MSRPGMQSSRSYSYYTAGTGSNEVTTLRHYIRTIDGSQVASILHSSDTSLLPAEISVREKLRVGSKEVNFRRVYLMNHMYKVGWVVDYDIDFCMLCSKDFSWIRGRAKHHCRACGNLICYKCSPNVAEVPYLGEEKESRVCKACFGVKSGVMTPQQKNEMIEELVKTVEEEERFVQVHREEQESLLQQSIHRVNSQSLQKSTSQSLSRQSSSNKNGHLSHSVPTEGFLQRSLSSNNNGSSTHRAYSPTPSLSSARVVLFATPDDAATARDSFKSGSSRKAVTTHKRGSRSQNYSADDSMLDRYEEEMRRWEEQQRPMYEEAYRMMRELIPLDIYKSSMRRLVDQGVPILAANRIWNTKILWLICTHRDDIVKIHLADFRSKYAYDGLDLIEMRAIWYNLPEWDVYSSNPLEKGKAEWKDGLKAKLDEMSYKEAKGSLPQQFCRHPAYDDCTLLHIFNPEADLRPRFHRSASFKQQAVESPMEMHRPLTQEEEDDLIWRAKYAATTPVEAGKSIHERKKAYLENFQDEDEDEDEDDEDKNNNGGRYQTRNQQRKYQSLVDEINGEEQEDDEDYALEDDDISSLGLESNMPSENNTPYHPQQRPFSSSRGSNRLDITVNSITTIPELTTPEYSSSSTDQHTGKDSVSPLPSPKQPIKQPRSQLLQQHARPLATTNSDPVVAKKKSSKQARNNAKQAKYAQLDDYDRVAVDAAAVDEAAKARAREEFLASRRAMTSSGGSVSSGGTGLATSPVTASGSLIPQQRQQEDAASLNSSSNHSSANVSASSNSKPAIPPSPLRHISSTNSVNSKGKPLNNNNEIATTETSRNSSFSTTVSNQSRNNNTNTAAIATQSQTAPKSSSSFSTTVSSQSTTIASSTSMSRELASKSRDISPLPPLRYQPSGSSASQEKPSSPAVPSPQRPFVPLTRSYTQVIDDENKIKKAAVKEVGQGEDEVNEDEQEEEEEEEEDGIIETRTPAFFYSPSESSQQVSEGGDTFMSVDSQDQSVGGVTPQTPASSQSYKFLSHSKKFGLQIDDSPSVLLNTQQKRQQQRLLSQRSVERERHRAIAGHLTPNITQTLVYTNEKPTVTGSRSRGVSHDALYQPGSDDRSYRRASTNQPVSNEQSEDTSASSAAVASEVENIAVSLSEHEYDMVADQLVNDQDGTSPMTSPLISHTQSLLISQSQQGDSTEVQAQKISVANTAANRADIMRALFEEDTELVYERLGDDPITSVFHSETDQILLSRIYWQCLLMQRYQTVLFLIDEAAMEIDAVCEDDSAQAEQDGRSALHYAVMENAEAFGRQLIRRGANIFLRDQRDESPLSFALKAQQASWLVEEYQMSGEEDVLTANGSEEDKFQYISYFVLTGILVKVKALLASGQFSISSSQATTLLNACKGNFDQMQDPVETFELLMSLDAEM